MNPASARQQKIRAAGSLSEVESLIILKIVWWIGCCRERASVCVSKYASADGELLKRVILKYRVKRITSRERKKTPNRPKK